MQLVTIYRILAAVVPLSEDIQCKDNLLVHKAVVTKRSHCTSISLPMPPEGEVSLDSKPTSGKAPCTCLATLFMLSPKLQ